MDDVYIYLVDMQIDEAVAPCGAFGYTVYINARLSQEKRSQALLHALRHIARNDFEKDSVQEIEKECRKERSTPSCLMDGEPSDT